MSKHKLLLEYKENVEKVRKRAKARDLNDKQINEIFENCFKHLKNKASSSNVCVHKSKAQNVFIWIFKAFLCFTGFLFVFYIILNVHQPTTSIVLRNVQGLIYPGLKLIRYFSVPIIKRFPQLTGLFSFFFMYKDYLNVIFFFSYLKFSTKAIGIKCSFIRYSFKKL